MTRICIVALSLLTLTGCMSYTVVSVGTAAATGKGVGDHIASGATGNDCNSVKLISSRQDYYCEQPREPGTTYNRNRF